MQRRGAATLLASLAGWFKVQPGEGIRVCLMIAYSASIGVLFTVGLTLTESLFLGRLPASDTPALFIYPGIADTVTLLLYNRLATRVRSASLAVLVPLMLAGVAMLFRVLLTSSAGNGYGALTALYVFWDMSCIILLVQFWTFAGQIFNPRESRRLFGIVAAGGTSANVASGLFVSSLGRTMGVENLLFVVVAALLLCGACAAALGRATVVSDTLDNAGSTADTNDVSFRRDLSNIWRRPLLRAIAAVAIILSFLINIAEYEFFLAVQQDYAGRPQELVVFLGGFAFWANLGALLAQFALAGMLLRRFGAGIALLSYPLALGTAAIASLIAGGALWTITLMRAATPVLAIPVGDAAKNALYLPIPAEQTARAKPLIEGIFSITFGVAGVLFLGMQWVPGWTYLDWSPILFALVTCSIALISLSRRQYTRALADSVTKRRLDFSQSRLDITDEAAVRVLVRALHADDELQVVHALCLIADAPGRAWDNEVVALLAHPAASVRVQALRYLGRTASWASSGAVIQLLSAPEDDVRAAAVDALCALSGAEAAVRIMPLLDDTSPKVTAAAIAHLLRFGADTEAARAAVALEAMLASAEPAQRQAAIGVLAALGDPPVVTRGLAFLEGDAADQGSLAKAQRPVDALIQRLILLLGDRQSAAAAADALARHGSASLIALDDVLADPTRGRAVRERIPGIMRRIGGQASADVLIRHLPEPDDIVRASVLQALAHLRREGSTVAAGQAALLAAAMNVEIRKCYAVRVLREDLRTSEDDLLDEALMGRLRQGLGRVFSLLEVRYPVAAVAQACQAIEGVASGTRQMAIELLDSVVERQVKAVLIPLLEAPVERVIDIARKGFDIERQPVVIRLAYLAQGPDGWLSACALHRVGLLGLHSLASVVIASLEAVDPVVREAALAACRRLLEPGDLSRVAMTQANDVRFPTVQGYARSILVELGSI